MNAAIYPILVTIISVAVSICIFLRAKKGCPEAGHFFKQYAWGFLLMSPINLPLICINLGNEISYYTLLALYAVSFVAVYFSYLLFFRGTISLFSKGPFLNIIFPIVSFSMFVIALAGMMLLLKIETFLIYTALAWGFFFPISAYIAVLFFYYFIKGAPLDNMKRKSYAIFFGILWFAMLATDAAMWISVTSYPHEFWIMKVVQQNGFLVFRGLVYILLFANVVSYGKYLEKIKYLNKDEKAGQ